MLEKITSYFHKAVETWHILRIDMKSKIKRGKDTRGFNY